MLHAILRYMVSAGHEARIIVRTGEPTTYQDIDIDLARPSRLRDHYRWCDVVITHLDVTRKAVATAERFGKPVVHLVHNDSQLRFFDVNPDKTALAVMNSVWLDRAYKWWKGPKTICIPPVFSGEYRTHRPAQGGCITLINLAEAKGAPIFWEMARRMPDRTFLGVKGAYAIQEIPPRAPCNVRLVDNTPDVHSIYEQTRILLMPSTYESWGRCAIEAAASGIPTIASPTPGLRESLGYSGYFAKSRNVAEWCRAVEIVERHYTRYSNTSLRRSQELDRLAHQHLQRLESDLCRIADHSPIHA